MADELYSNAVLRLAADIPRIGRLERPQASVRKVSRLCGSEIEIDIVMRGERVADLALRVKACALGQASASVLGQAVIGRDRAEIAATRDQLRAMLKEDAPPPSAPFADLEALLPARDFPNRHASILLAWEATLDAMDQALADA